ncbi:MAG: hypothetical protein ACYDHH_31380 [Solirubrobacteraceae bacterium]
MSRDAVAAVLARDDVACGDRLTAFSLASFAGREHRAWPGAAAAAQRAGLSRSRYLQARDRLVRRGLVVVEAEAPGRGRSSTVVLAFAASGPWWEGELNVELLEAVLGYSATTGVARLLLAAMAAIADEDGAVRDFTTEQICAAAGIAGKSYQRAKGVLLGSRELVLVNGVGGRGNTNAWVVADPRMRNGAVAQRAPWRVAPAAGARPLLGVAPTPTEASAEARGAGDGGKGGQDQTVSAQNRLRLTGLSGAKGGQDQTLSDPAAAESQAQRVAKRVAKSRALNARAGTEPLNPRTGDPPTPLKGGGPADRVLIEQPFISERGRKRRRMVPVDLAEVRRGLDPPRPSDRADWERIREIVRDRLGEDMFGIWLGSVELIAVDASVLVIAAPPETVSWVRDRFGRLLSAGADRAGRAMRLAEESERLAFASKQERVPVTGSALDIRQQEVM